MPLSGNDLAPLQGPRSCAGVFSYRRVPASAIIIHVTILPVEFVCVVL